MINNETKRRKLPKPLRAANLVYKIIMAVMAGLSLIFATMTDIDSIYYQVVSVFSSAFPVIWSQILDACKQYEEERTPEPSPDRSDSPDEVPEARCSAQDRS